LAPRVAQQLRGDRYFDDADAIRRERIGNRVEHRRRRANRAALAEPLGAGDAWRIYPDIRRGHWFNPSRAHHCFSMAYEISPHKTDPMGSIWEAKRVRTSPAEGVMPATA
jgi:hypothetical protein